MKKLIPILDAWKKEENILNAFKKYNFKKSEFAAGEFTIALAQILEIKNVEFKVKAKLVRCYNTQVQNEEVPYIKNKELDERNLRRFLTKFDDDFLTYAQEEIDKVVNTMTDNISGFIDEHDKPGME